MTTTTFLNKPDIKISVKQTFGLDSDMEVNSFSKKNEYVPKLDPDYKFDRDTTLAILAGFSNNKKSSDTRLSWYWKIYSYRASSS